MIIYTRGNSSDASPSKSHSSVTSDPRAPLDNMNYYNIVISIIINDNNFLRRSNRQRRDFSVEKSKSQNVILKYLPIGLVAEVARLNVNSLF